MDHPTTPESQLQKAAKSNNCETCLTFPQASPENLKFLSELLTFTTAHYEVQFKRQIEDDPSNSLAKKGLQTIKNEINAGKVELKPGSGVFIRKEILKDLLRDFGNKPTSLLRRLVRILVGDVFLVGMSAMGEGGYDPIPTPVMDAIKDLWIKFPKSPKLSPTMFTRIINVLCSQLRGREKGKSKPAEAAANDRNKNRKKTDSKASTAPTSSVKKIPGRGGTWTVSPMKIASSPGTSKGENVSAVSSVNHHTATHDLPASPASSSALSVRCLSPSGLSDRHFTQSTSLSAAPGGVEKTPSSRSTSIAVRTLFPSEYSEENAVQSPVGNPEEKAVKSSVGNSRWQAGHVDSVNDTVAPGGYDQSGQYSYPFYPDTRFFSPPPSTSSYPFSSYYCNPNQPPPGPHYESL